MKKSRFNQGWTFHEGGGGSLDVLSNTRKMAKAVTLPHDASIEKERNPEEENGSGNGFFREETVHYTKEFFLEETDCTKTVWLEFEGVYHNAFVYINHSFVGRCPYGYSDFYIDATKYVHFGKKNEIKVVVKNGVPSGRWYTGCGIYRDVNLMVADRLHLVPEGIHLTTEEIEEGQAVVRAEAVIAYTGTGTRGVRLEIALLDADGGVAAKASMPVTVEEHTERSYSQRLYVTNPKLWSVDSPVLYAYRARILEDGTAVDEEDGTFGIRKLQLDPRHGLRINGETLKLRGGCIHHDNGVIGAVEFPHAAEYRVRKLKEAGYNAIRSSHYPMSRCLLEACDRLGMLVMDEYADVWTSSKVDYDYSLYITEWWERDVASLVNKDYNHPCVIFYSIGNEIPETGNRFDVQFGKKIADTIRRLDDSRYLVNSVNLMMSISEHMEEILSGFAGEEGKEMGEAVVGENAEINSIMNNLEGWMNQVITSETAGRVTEEAFTQVDIAGYNYGAARYEMDGQCYPNRIIVGSETYAKDLDRNWELVEKLPYLLGDFSWTAWDYLGEAGIGKVSYGEEQNGMGFYASYPYKAAYCGDFNLIGDRRPVSYWREIIWGLRKAPYLSVQPPAYYGAKRSITSWGMTDAVRSWNWSGYEGKPVIVEMYTDAEEAELYLDGCLLERKKAGETKKGVVLFETVYRPGKLEAVAYKGGVETGRDTIVTAEEETVLSVHTDAEQIPADGSDICYLDLSVMDVHGRQNPGAKKSVEISVEGPAVVQGFGSADPNSTENYFDRQAAVYEGRLFAAIRGTGEPGTVTVTFRAEGCEDATVQIEAV